MPRIQSELTRGDTSRGLIQRSGELVGIDHSPDPLNGLALQLLLRRNATQRHSLKSNEAISDERDLSQPMDDLEIRRVGNGSLVCLLVNRLGELGRISFKFSNHLVKFGCEECIAMGPRIESRWK